MCTGAFAVILQQLNCSLGYVYEIMGVLIGSAVAPIAMVSFTFHNPSLEFQPRSSQCHRVGMQ